MCVGGGWRKGSQSIQALSSPACVGTTRRSGAWEPLARSRGGFLQTGRGYPSGVRVRFTSPPPKSVCLSSVQRSRSGACARERARARARVCVCVCVCVCETERERERERDSVCQVTWVTQSLSPGSGRNCRAPVCRRGREGGAARGPGTLGTALPISGRDAASLGGSRPPPPPAPAVL